MNGSTMSHLLGKCPTCGAAILICANGYLDAKPVADGGWGVLQVGPFCMMATGALLGGSRHELHDHQPAGDDA